MERNEKNKIENFYRNFEKKNSKNEIYIDLQPFVICALLMTEGSSSEKAELIWENLDLNCNGTLNGNQVEFYINTAINLVYQQLPEFALGEKYPSDSNKLLEKQTIEKLKQKWKKIDLKQKFMKQISINKDEISRKDFVSRISQSNEIDFTSTFGLRQ